MGGLFLVIRVTTANSPHANLWIAPRVLVDSLMVAMHGKYFCFCDGNFLILSQTSGCDDQSGAPICTQRACFVEELEEATCNKCSTCDTDVKQCPNGISYVSRDPENDCEFAPCPAVDCMTCPCGYFDGCNTW